MVSGNGHTPILKVDDLVTRFYTPEGVVHAVNGVSFDVMEGEMLGVVGESGCGKSVTMLSILQLIAIPPGKIERGHAWFDGKDLVNLSPDQIRDVRGSQIGMVFQDPMTFLNPVLTIEKQISESLMLHLRMNKDQARERVIELLQLVGIPEASKRLNAYPHQFSGGMRQRVMIAMALACDPRILIADEPTTALDVTIQAQIVDLVKQLREAISMTIIWITHDLGVVARLAQRVIVMYAGFIIEEAPVKELYGHPAHPLYGGSARQPAESDQRYTRAPDSDPRITPHAAQATGRLPIRAALHLRVRPVPGGKPSPHPGGFNAPYGLLVGY